MLKLKLQSFGHLTQRTDSDVGQDWRREEKGMTEDEIVGWHHGLDELESGWTPGDGDGQGGLACCDSWGRKESDMTERLNWTGLHSNGCVFPFLLCLSLLFFSQLFVRPTQTTILPFVFLFLGDGFHHCLLYNVMNLHHSSLVILSIRSNPLNLFVTSTASGIIRDLI